LRGLPRRTGSTRIRKRRWQAFRTDRGVGAIVFHVVNDHGDMYRP
jgi:hypothetical protein